MSRSIPVVLLSFLIVQGACGSEAELAEPPVAGRIQALGTCQGWWGGNPGPGPHRSIVWANPDSDTSHYSKIFQANCSQAAKDIGDNPCGPDDDNVVSFWLGSAHSTFRSDYKVYSEDVMTALWLWVKQTTHSAAAKNTRVYQYGKEGNAYFCLPKRYPADKLRFGW